MSAPGRGSDWWRAGAVELGAAYREGRCDPPTALDACLARIDAVNPRLNAFVAQRREAARSDARRSAERLAAGTPLSPLDGIPVAVKDSILTADLPTTWGSIAGRAHQPEHDELAVARLRAAGALIVGKTNVPEFTLEGYTGNALFGVTGNPWNPTLTPGGSSGGSAAAVASGMVPLAIGTDGGGSIRRPASHTGLVGLKPTLGAVARVHTLPQVLLDFEVVGPMAREVDDLRLLFEVLRGPDPLDRDSQAAAATAAARPAAPQRLRILYVPALGTAPVDPQVTASCSAAIEAFAAAGGHRLTVSELPFDIGFLQASWPLIGQIGLAWLFGWQPDWRDGAAPKYHQLADLGARIPASDLWQVREAALQLRRDAARLFADGCDLIATPAAAALPWPADQAFPPRIDGQEVGPRGHAVFTGWVNAAGLPALALPCRPCRDGMPIGLQLVGAAGADLQLLDVAANWRQALGQPWRWPTL